MWHQGPVAKLASKKCAKIALERVKMFRDTRMTYEAEMLCSCPA